MASLGYTREYVFNELQKEQAAFAAEIERNVGKNVVTTSYVRSIVTLGTQTDISFKLLENETNAGNANVLTPENRIKRNDAFLCIFMNVMIAKKADANVVSKWKYRQFPNPRVFNGAGEADNFEGFYKGRLEAIRNQKSLFPNIEMAAFYKASANAEGLAASTGNTGVVQQEDLEIYASAIRLNPSIRFSGSDNNEVNIKFPESLALGGLNGTSNIAILEMYGVMAQNSAAYVAEKNK